MITKSHTGRTVLLKILMLNYEFPPIGGGAGQAQLALLKEFATFEDMRVDVLTAGTAGTTGIERLGENITIERIGIHKQNLHHWKRSEIITWLFKAGWRYRKILKNEHYDVIHIFFGVPTGLICRMCGTGRVPYIVSMRGSDVPGTSVSFKLEHRILSKALTWIWRNAAALVACSEGLKERALSNDASLKIDVITNGVDLDKFRPGPGRKQGVWRLGTVGRLTDSKRYNVLIGTVERLSNDGHMVELAIAGTGKLDGELRGLVKERGLEAVVKFHGRIEAEKMPEFYKKIDVFVSATAAEGMSNAMLEAMASGLPIVTTQCEGLRELIVDNGIIVEEGVDDFAAAVQSLLGDQEKYAAMCAAARRQAEQFTWHRAAEHYAGIYKRIAERRDKGL